MTVRDMVRPTLAATRERVKALGVAIDPRRLRLYDHPTVMASSKPTQRPIADVEELVAHFRAGFKPRANARVGMEHEKVGALSDGRAPGYELIARLLEAMAVRGWHRIGEHGRLIALERPICGTITLEPGGQVEHSGAPWPTSAEAVHDNNKHMDELLPLAAELGISFLAVGFRPFGTLEDVPWMPKGRYKVMRAYLPSRGRLAHEMMKRTATVQANLDYSDEADAMQMLRLGLGLSSLVTAMFAASPLVDGRPSGYQSYRAACWLETDPDRCGLLPFAFEPRAGFRDYVEWALDVPMFFLYRDGEYRALDERVTFRRFLREGLAGERAQPSDWELHLSTLFPEVRLKRYVEVRQADAGSRELVSALPPLWRGLLYDPEAARAAWSLVSGWTMDERQALYRATPREGLRATVRGIPLRQLCKELVAISKAGLGRLNAVDGVRLLAPLEQVIEEGRTQSDRILDEYARANGDTSRLIEALRLK
jgi:glutamate--cysteine ligase